MSAIATGARGTLDGRSYLVLGSVTFVAKSGEHWVEYLLAHGSERRWLTIERDRDNAYLWRLVRASSLPKAGELRVGDAVNVDKLHYDIDESGTKTVSSFDGDPEDDLDCGETVQYAEGHSSGGLRVSIERWANDAAEAFVGIPLPIRQTEGWRKPSNAVAPRPLRRRTRQEVVQASTGESLFGLAFGVLFLGFILWAEGCTYEQECRYYRADGTSYTEKCSHYDANSVRSESTGRRIAGFGK